MSRSSKTVNTAKEEAMAAVIASLRNLGIDEETRLRVLSRDDAVELPDVPTIQSARARVLDIRSKHG